MRGDVSTSLTAPSSRLKEGIMSDRWFPLQSKRTHARRIRRVRGFAAIEKETGGTANCGLTDEDSFRLAIFFQSKSNTDRPNPDEPQEQTITLSNADVPHPRQNVHYGDDIRHICGVIFHLVTRTDKFFLLLPPCAFINFPSNARESTS